MTLSSPLWQKLDNHARTTEEGRKQFKAEYDALCEMAPELMKKEHLVYPHEMPAFVPNEPHF